MIRLQTNQPNHALNVVRLAIENVIAPTAVQIGALNRLVGGETSLRYQNLRKIDLLRKINVFIALCTRTLRGRLAILGPVLH